MQQQWWHKAKTWVSYLNGWHEAVCDDAHAQEHVDERNKVNDSPGHFVPDRRVLGVPHGQHHSWNEHKVRSWESVYWKENVLNDLLSASLHLICCDLVPGSQAGRSEWNYNKWGTFCPIKTYWNGSMCAAFGTVKWHNELITQCWRAFSRGHWNSVASISCSAPDLWIQSGSVQLSAALTPGTCCRQLFVLNYLGKYTAKKQKQNKTGSKTARH